MEIVCAVSALEDFNQQFGGVDEVFLLSFLISVGIAVVLAPLYLMIYQAFVAMLMHVKDPQAVNTATVTIPHTYTPSNNLLSATHKADLQMVMKSRYRQFNRTLLITLVFYTLCMMVLMVLYGPGEFGPEARLTQGWLEEKLGFAVFVVIMVLPVLNQLFLPGWHLRIMGFLLAIFVLGIGLNEAFSESAENAEALLDNISLFLFICVALIGFAIQKVRNVAAQISMAVQVFFISSFLYVLMLDLLGSCLLTPVFGELKQTQLDMLIFFALLAYFPLLYLIWRVLIYFVRKMVSAYDKGYYSDFQLQTVLWLMLITLFIGAAISADQSGDNALDQRSAYALWVLLMTVALYLLLNRRIPAWKPAHSLLYLRVFATDKYSEYLLDYVAKHWRHIGPINMIGGPDFALFNLDIREAYYLLFKRTAIHELFIDEPAVLEQRLENMSCTPSSDRQYTINEFFCTDNMWQQTVAELAQRSGHVLLDLRGFSAERKGAEFELHLLADMDLLKHTTIVVDSRTDWDAIRLALQDLPDVVIPDECVLEMRGSRISHDLLSYLGR
ncbi:MAG: hypothetical protein R3F02_11545 [Thiolinea sp.]